MMSTRENLEWNESGGSIRQCAACEWCQYLEDSRGRTIWFCMNTESAAYLEQTDLLGWCTIEDEEEDDAD